MYAIRSYYATGFSLVITDVGGGHDDPASQAEYASLPTEMKSVAAELGAKVLREVTLEQIIDKIPEIREKTGDRAILRARITSYNVCYTKLLRPCIIDVFNQFFHVGI